MFSEYASRFLAQSQSRLLSSQTDRAASPNPSEDGRSISRSSRAPSRAYLQRQPLGNPYQGTAPQSSRFPFASRFGTPQHQAPLFYSVTDDFREEDNVQERDREVADFYALQRSRRDFGRGGRLAESDESDKEDPPRQRSRRGFLGRKSQVPKVRQVKGIRSSWTGDEEAALVEEEVQPVREDISQPRTDAESSSTCSTKGKDRLVDVELASTVPEDQELMSELERADDMATDEDYEIRPDPMNDRRPIPPQHLAGSKFMHNSALDQLPSLLRPRPPSPDVESVPPTTDVSPPAEGPRHDTFWAMLYQLTVAAMLASFALSFLHNPSAPSTGSLGDTIFTTLHSSFYLLAVDTLVATIVALFWLAMLRSFVRPLVMMILVAVPILAASFSLYPFISSFRGTWHGDSLQDQAMRWLSLIPAIFAVGWTYTAYKSRRSLGRAIEILEFSTRVLAASPALILVGFATLVFVVVWTWIWMLMFTRLFLGGHSTKNLFAIDTGTWCLAIFFILTYLWTLSVASGLQRATSAATVSQWYFHRLSNPSVHSSHVVVAAFDHAFTTIFGTICLSTLLALAIRLPLLVLPRRVGGIISMCFYTFIPGSIATLTNPLTLTYAAIHSQNLTISAQGLAEMYFISPNSPTTTLTPGAAARSDDQNGNPTPLLAYRYAKLLLHATRFITALAFGFGGWVSTARMLTIEGAAANMRGSLYAYVVGLLAGAIGWAVLGAMEGVLGGVLDAVVVCWGSEVGRGGGIGTGGGRGYCREAGELLGGDYGNAGMGRGGGIGL